MNVWGCVLLSGWHPGVFGGHRLGSCDKQWIFLFSINWILTPWVVCTYLCLSFNLFRRVTPLFFSIPVFSRGQADAEPFFLLFFFFFLFCSELLGGCIGWPPLSSGMTSSLLDDWNRFASKINTLSISPTDYRMFLQSLIREQHKCLGKTAILFLFFLFFPRDASLPQFQLTRRHGNPTHVAVHAVSGRNGSH